MEFFVWNCLGTVAPHLGAGTCKLVASGEVRKNPNLFKQLFTLHTGSIYVEEFRRQILRLAQSAKHRSILVAKAVLTCLILAAGAAISASAQEGAMSPYQGEKDGVSAGGKWMEFDSEDKMTGAKKARFELLADNFLSQDPDYKPRIELMCSENKLTYADFNPGIRLGPPNRPGFWGQPQMEVMVRTDDVHNYHGWNWIRDRFLSMDKGTTRGLIGAQVFKVQIRGQKGYEIAEFSPSGLNLDRVKQACDLTPKKPSKD
jgi:hypothetical protein